MTAYPEILTDNQGLGDLIHDRYFDLDQLFFDEAARELRLSLGNERRGPYDDKLLRITGVTAVTVDDRIAVGCMGIDIDISIASGSKIYITHTAPKPYKRMPRRSGSVFGGLLRLLRLKRPATEERESK